MKRQSWLAITGTLLAAACAPTLSVYGIMGGDIYTGTTTGEAQHGDMKISNNKGKICLGERRGVASLSGGSGHGVLTCNDGTQIVIQYTKVGFASGYGFGTSSN